MKPDFPVSPLAPDAFPELPEVKGVQLLTGSLGLYGERDDFFVAAFPDGASAAGVFTTSSTASADVKWCREALRKSKGQARGLVVNSGNSNAFTGLAGLAKNNSTVAKVSGLLDCASHEVFLAATGVIGEPMPADQLSDGVASVWNELGQADFKAAAHAFMTTDTFAKAAATEVEIEGGPVSIVGIAKGSGMIAPNMATMLAYVFTDANIAPEVLQEMLSSQVDETFNCITVDGDTSTSDTVMVFATGASGGPLIDRVDHPDLLNFAPALKSILMELSHLVVRDGEGASKFIEITVESASTPAAARRIAASVANSPLVKTALTAGDANWGRIIMAIGKSGEHIDIHELSLSIGPEMVAVNGMRAPDYSEEAATRACSGDEIFIHIDIGMGNGRATIWTCDLTHGYIDINGAYRS